MDLRHRVGSRVGEGGLERTVEESPHQPVDDGVAKLFLALEVVVEVALAHAALPEDVVERRTVIALEVDEAPSRVQDLIPRHGSLRALRIGQHRVPRDSHGRALYQTVSTIASNSPSGRCSYHSFTANSDTWRTSSESSPTNSGRPPRRTTGGHHRRSRARLPCRPSPRRSSLAASASRRSVVPDPWGSTCRSLRRGRGLGTEGSPPDGWGPLE